MSTFKPDELMRQNYLQNKLSPEDEEQMELWLADHPDALEEMELDLLMKAGVIENQGSLTVSPSSSANYWKPMAMAASVAFMLVTAFLLNEKLASESVGVISPKHIELSQDRSIQTQVAQFKNTEHVLLQIPVNIYEDSDYKVEIIQNEYVLLSVDSMAPQMGSISLFITEQTYPPGKYQLELTQLESQQIQQFLFEITD